MATRKRRRRVPWNKDRIVGQKAPLKLCEIWAIRIRRQLRSSVRDLALFNLAIDSKLRACDLLSLRVDYLAHDGSMSARTVAKQRKTHRLAGVSRGVRFGMKAAAGSAPATLPQPIPDVARSASPAYCR
jgi:hypothetical protein